MWSGRVWWKRTEEGRKGVVVKNEERKGGDPGQINDLPKRPSNCLNKNATTYFPQNKLQDSY